MNNKMTVGLETITPAMAKAMLDGRDTLNRSVRMVKVKAMSKDMMNGRWVLSPQGVVFDINGRLIDGQHRLTAIVDADVPVDMYVARNAPQELKGVIDSGSARSPADRAVIAGVLPPGSQKKRAAILGLIRNALHSVNHGALVRSYNSLTVDEMRTLWAQFGTDIDCVMEALPSSEHTSIKCAAFAIAYPINPSACDVMMAQIKTSVGITANGGAHHMVICDNSHRRLVSDDIRMALMVRYLRCIELTLNNETAQRIVVQDGVAPLLRIFAKRMRAEKAQSLSA